MTTFRKVGNHIPLCVHCNTRQFDHGPGGQCPEPTPKAETVSACGCNCCEGCKRRWIPCAERMPVHGESVLVLVSVGGMRPRYIGMYDSVRRRWWIRDETLEPSAVTHWMLLPEKPCE